MTTLPTTEDLPITQRLTTLEKQVAELLKINPSAHQVSDQSWIATVGTWQDDAISREADALGEAWRKSVED